MRRTPLNREQRRVAAEIARDRVEPCYFCGSREWQSPLGAEPSTGDFALVMTCANCGDGTGVMYLSREEAAQRLNLRHGPYPNIDETGGP